jgi:putative glutamine amidotransferase
MYEQAVRDAGGVPRPTHPRSCLEIREVLAALDAVMLTGGGDVDPRAYGQPVREDPGLNQPVEVDAARDALEIPLARAALAEDRPLLAICRGVQVLNVAAGGDLVQDTSMLGLDAAAHDQTRRRPAIGRADAAHAVQLAAGSRIAEICGAPEISVNSFHHQTLGRVAPVFEATGTSPDGVIEAIESRTHRFALGVQWHPERMREHDAAQRRLFEALVGAARGAPRATAR